VVLHRNAAQGGAHKYHGAGGNIEYGTPEVPGGDDTSDATWLDENPHSNGHVYDIDFPGTEVHYWDMGRIRANFVEQAKWDARNGTVVSDPFDLSVAHSATRGADLPFATDHTMDGLGDNAMSQTFLPSTTWDMK
jgi:hypothetical protein